jgi:hypothetical protein
MRTYRGVITILALVCFAALEFQGCAAPRCREPVIIMPEGKVAGGHATKGKPSGDFSILGIDGGGEFSKWSEIKAKVEEQKDAKEYPAAISLLDSVDATLLKNPDIKADVEAKRHEVIEHGKVEVIKDRDAANDLIDKKKFSEARELIDRMKAIYTYAVFSGKNYWVASQSEYLETRWKTEEREERSWLLHKVTSKTDNETLRRQIGVGFGNHGNYEIKYYDQNLFYHFNSDKKMNAASYAASIGFAVQWGRKDISDYRSLSFYFHHDSRWDVAVKVTMDCGAGGSYQYTKSAGIAGGYFTINRSDWATTRGPNTANDKPFQVVSSVRIEVSLKTRDGKPTTNATFFEINSVQFVK